MPKIGIICAAGRELEPFLSHITRQREIKKAMLTFYEGEINGLSAVALYCGVCKTNAAVAAQMLIDAFGADIIINSGTAGGMSAKVDILDTVVATECAHHDVHEDILTQYHPWMPSVFFRSDERLLAAARRAAARLGTKNRIFFGRMVTGEQFISDEGRERINSTFEPLTVDMETASIAQVCYVNAVPFIAVRTVTDTVLHCGEQNFELSCAAASEIAKDIVLALLDEIKKGEKNDGVSI